MSYQSHRETDLQLRELREHLKQGNPEIENRLRKQLHYMCSLLDDAQIQIQHEVSLRAAKMRKKKDCINPLVVFKYAHRQLSTLE